MGFDLHARPLPVRLGSVVKRVANNVYVHNPGVCASVDDVCVFCCCVGYGLCAFTALSDTFKHTRACARICPDNVDLLPWSGLVIGVVP